MLTQNACIRAMLEQGYNAEELEEGMDGFKSDHATIWAAVDRIEAVPAATSLNDVLSAERAKVEALS